MSNLGCVHEGGCTCVRMCGGVAPDRGLRNAVVDDQVRSVVSGEGGPRNWDSVAPTVGIPGENQEWTFTPED